MSVRVDVEGLLPLKAQLKLLRLSPKRRKRILNRVAKQVIRDAKGRVRKQVDLQGRPFEKHSKKRRRKMLARLVRRLRVTRVDGRSATVGFYNRVEGRIAADQQFGKVTVVNASDLPRTPRQAPATRRQAKALKELGYKVKKAGSKRKRKPSIKWMIKNMSIAKAGAIVRTMRESQGLISKARWRTSIAARSFLGSTAEENRKRAAEIVSELNLEIKNGNR